MIDVEYIVVCVGEGFKKARRRHDERGCLEVKGEEKVRNSLFDFFMNRFVTNQALSLALFFIYMCCGVFICEHDLQLKR